MEEGEYVEHDEEQQLQQNDGSVSDGDDEQVVNRRDGSGAVFRQSARSAGNRQSTNNHERCRRRLSWVNDLAGENEDQWVRVERERRRPTATSTLHRSMYGNTRPPDYPPWRWEPRAGPGAQESFGLGHHSQSHPGPMLSTETPSRINQSSMGQPKMHKVDPFPKGTKPTDQYQEWNYWKANFEMAAEKAGLCDQRALSIELSLHIGEEVRRIIIAKDFLPAERSVGPDYPFYDAVVGKLDQHFRNLTDISVDIISFNKLAQAADETAQEFDMRLRMMAKRAQESNPVMLRTRLLEGLRDKDLSQRAYIEGFTHEEVVRMATRKEALSLATSRDFTPWEVNPGRAQAVAAVKREEQQRKPDPGSKGHGRGNRPEVKPYAKERGRHARVEKLAGGRCAACGTAQHRTDRCPAESATCWKCKEVGHFQHMCPRQIRSVDEYDDQRSEVGTAP